MRCLQRAAAAETERATRARESPGERGERERGKAKRALLSLCLFPLLLPLSLSIALARLASRAALAFHSPVTLEKTLLSSLALRSEAQEPRERMKSDLDWDEKSQQESGGGQRRRRPPNRPLSPFFPCLLSLLLLLEIRRPPQIWIAILSCLGCRCQFGKRSAHAASRAFERILTGACCSLCSIDR